LSYGLFRRSLKTFLFGQFCPQCSATCVNCALEIILTYLLSSQLTCYHGGCEVNQEWLLSSLLWDTRHYTASMHHVQRSVSSTVFSWRSRLCSIWSLSASTCRRQLVRLRCDTRASS